MRLFLTIIFALAMAEKSIAESKATIDLNKYTIDACMLCHGVDGKGNESIQAPKLVGMEDWYIKRQLELFRAGLRGTHANDIDGLGMQAIAARLSDKDIATIVKQIDTWQETAATVTLAGDKSSGKQLYQTCAACHGSNGEGNSTIGSPALAGQSDWYLLNQLIKFEKQYRGGVAADTYGSQMAAAVDVLKDRQAMNDVVAYVNTLSTH